MASTTTTTTTANTAAAAVAQPGHAAGGWGTQAPTTPCHAKAITGRQLAAKLGVATGTIRRHRAALGIVNSGNGYSPEQQQRIAKAVAKAAAKQPASKPAAKATAKAQPAKATERKATDSNAHTGTRAERRRAAAAASLGSKAQG